MMTDVRRDPFIRANSKATRLTLSLFERERLHNFSVISAK